MRMFANVIGAGIALLLAGGAWAGTLAWKSRLPQQRINAAMVYDSSRHAAVMFGGQVPSGLGYAYLADTWVWTTSTWTPRQVAGPSARSAHAMAYDSARGVTVLFGGKNASVSNAETWEWNGASWTQRNIPGPSARYGAKMCFDSARNVIVLFGGFGGPGATYLGDTWEYDGVAWTQRVVSGPVARTGFAFAFDSVRGKAVLYGGLRSNLPSSNPILSNETWTWDGTTWTQVAVTGPQAIQDTAAAFDSARGVVVLNGGTTSTITTKQTWEWNGVSWTKRIDGSARAGHAMAYVPENGGVLVYGGWPTSGNNIPLGDIRRWNGTNWADVSLAPMPRTSAVAAYHTGRQKTIMALGYTFSSGMDVPVNDGFEWNGNVWSSAGPIGAQAFAGGIAYDSARGKVVFFSGAITAQQFSNWTHEWNGPGTWTPRTDAGPIARVWPSMIYDSVRNQTVVFGGAYDAYPHPLWDMWQWDGTTWTELFVPSPSPRYGAAACFDSARGVMVIFGGCDGQVFFDETWEWDGTSWTQRMVTGPSPRSNAAMVYDAARGKCVLYGGIPDEVSDTWEWDGTAWTELPITGPLYTSEVAMAYDSDRQVTVLFGGSPPYPSVQYGSETWELAVVCPADLNADHVVDDSDFVLFAVAYDILDCADPAMSLGCPADLNADLVVDDSDFVLFAGAYDALLCW